MPRDKSLSHEKVKRAIRDEFLEKGYENASVRSIGARAGMTSAGLYRHYADKEAMFNAMVEPLLADIERWVNHHVKNQYDRLNHDVPGNEICGDNFLDMVREVILPRREEFILLMMKSSGTRHENFLHDFVVVNQQHVMEALKYLKEKGYPTMDVGEEELHMLLSAYVTACFEPVIHNYDGEKVDKYLNTVQAFFMPGWMKIMGIK